MIINADIIIIIIFLSSAEVTWSMKISEPGDGVSTSRVMHVRNLPEECNEMDIRSLCSQFGSVDR